MFWSISCVDYCKSAIQNLEQMLKSGGASPLKVHGDCKRPYPYTHQPEIDVTEELDDENVQRFQELIGVLCWTVELGCIDIMTEVSCLSQHLCSPRVGHPDAIYSIFQYLQMNMSKNP